MASKKTGENLLLGQNIRTARRERNISLKQMSRGTKLSVSFLSQLERGKANISVDNLRKIATFFDVTMVQLIDTDEQPLQGLVTRKGDGQFLGLEGTTATSESLIKKSNSNIQVTLYTNPPGEGRKIPFSHQGEELVYVIKGEVLFFLNDQKYHLKTGDSMYYRSEANHSWVNPGNDDCLIIIFNSPQAW